MRGKKWWGGGGGCEAQEFYHRFVYIAPSSDYSMLIFILLLKVTLRRF